MSALKEAAAVASTIGMAPADGPRSGALPRPSGGRVVSRALQGGTEPVLPETNPTSVVTVVLVGLVVLAAVVGIAALVRLLVGEWRKRG